MSEFIISILGTVAIWLLIELLTNPYNPWDNG